MIAVLVLSLLGAQEGLQAGFGRADITPAPGTEMPGGFGKRLSTGVRDPLWAVAAVVSDGKTPVALVGIDALFSPGDVVRKARALVERDTPIPGAHVLVGASHTHSGGPLLDCLGSTVDPAYADRVAEGIARAVADAWKALGPAEIGIGRGREDSISYNRRFLMKDGREITHPGKPGTPNHGKIVRPAGPIDPDVGVLAARRPKAASPFGLVVNFACHCTVVGGSQSSADYVGDLRRHLQARYGPETAVVFLQGACGDITQVDNLSPGRESGPEYADLMGMKLAAETARTVKAMAWRTSLSTASSSERIPLAVRAEPDPDAERPPFGLGSGQDEVYANERRLVAEERARTPRILAEVQGLRIGPLGIAANGSEYFVEYGLRLKQASPHETTWFVGYANDYIGYVATAQAFVAGGYEVRTARSSKLAPEAGQRLLEAALRRLEAVRE
jgi:neutral ceramidase